MKQNKPVIGLLFDLEKDPLELNNLYDNPAYAEHQTQLFSAIESWLKDTTPVEQYLNQNAPQISQPNVPPLDLSHRQEMIEYFRKKMEAFA